MDDFFMLQDDRTRTQRTHCNKGHLFSEENTCLNRRGGRFCKICDKDRKARFLYKERNTKEYKTEVVCPQCKRTRVVVKTTAKRLAKFPRLCQSCSRKIVRGKMAFQPAICAKCEKVFVGRSGAARFCDECVKRKPLEIKTCPICKTKYTGYKNKTACGQSCLRRLRLNDTYFGGRLLEAEGWTDGVCQLCNRLVNRKRHVHHVFGHPNHSMLVVFCPGCHDAVSKLAARKRFGEVQFSRLRWYVLAQKLGHAPEGEDKPP